MKLHLRLARASLRTLAWTLLILAGGVVALLRTALGHEVILGWAVAEADARVELRTPEGQVFLTADSVELSYSLRGLLGGDITLSDISLWGAEMDLVWEPGQERSTLQRWVSSPRPVEDRQAGEVAR